MDLISRQAALRTFGLSEKSRKYGGDHSGYQTIMLYEVQDALEALPSESRWIPVSERLPEPYTTVLITIKTRYHDAEPWDYYTDVGDYQEDGWETFNDWDEGQEYYITAWMPLPEPYCGARMESDDATS